jgi:hypothetical protein
MVLLVPLGEMRRWNVRDCAANIEGADGAPDHVAGLFSALFIPQMTMD